MERTILHCDLNGFYASVELRDRPDLWDKPVAVCGDPESRHGIILAKNEAAKRFQVKTAETIWQARKKCPGLILLPAHHEEYRRVSRRINAIYERYTDLVEPFGIDESWLDITGSMHLFGGDARDIADELRAVVRREERLTISVGVSFNKVFAKLGSDMKNPTPPRSSPGRTYRPRSGPFRSRTSCLSAVRPTRYSRNMAYAPSAIWWPSAARGWSAYWASREDSSTTTPLGWSTVRSPAPGSPLPRNPWATALRSAAICWDGRTSTPA